MVTSTSSRALTWLAASILALSGVLAAKTAGAQDAKEEFKRASDFFKDKKYSEALPHFQAAYQLSNKRPSAIRGLAQCEWALSDYDRALDHFHEYLNTTPRPEDADSIERTIQQVQQERSDASWAPKKEAPPPVAPAAGAVTNEPVPGAVTKPASNWDSAGWDTVPQKPETAKSGGGGISPWVWVGIGAAVVVVTVTIVLVVVLTKSDDNPDNGGFDLRAAPVESRSRGLSLSF